MQPAPPALAAPPPGAARSFRYDARPWRSSDELCTCKDRHACGTRLTAMVLRRSPGRPAAPSCGNRPSATEAPRAAVARRTQRAARACVAGDTLSIRPRPAGDPSGAQSGAVTGHWAACFDPRAALSANEGADSYNYLSLYFPRQRPYSTSTRARLRHGAFTAFLNALLASNMVARHRTNRAGLLATRAPSYRS